MMTLDQLQALTMHAGHGMRSAKDLMIPVERATLSNTYFRRVLWTGDHLQLVLMHLHPHQAIDWELHAHVDQFFRVEKGSITAQVRLANNTVSEAQAHAGDSILVPAGTHHQIVAGRNGAHIYTIYAPPNHPWNRAQKFKPIGD